MRLAADFRRYRRSTPEKLLPRRLVAKATLVCLTVPLREGCELASIFGSVGGQHVSRDRARKCSYARIQTKRLRWSRRNHSEPRITRPFGLLLFYSLLKYDRTLRSGRWERWSRTYLVWSFPNN